MTDQSTLGPWVKRFLLEYLPGERNFTRNTQQSYRDALRLLIVFAAGSLHKKPDQLLVEDIRADLLRKFMRHIEEVAKVQRFYAESATGGDPCASVFHRRALLPSISPWCATIRAIVFKRSPRVPVGYMEKNEIDALLDAPDNATWIGTRDRDLAAVPVQLRSTCQRSSSADSWRSQMAFHRDNATVCRAPRQGKQNTLLPAVGLHCPRAETTHPRPGGRPTSVPQPLPQAADSIRHP